MYKFDERRILPIGETILCKNGHRVCELVEPLSSIDDTAHHTSFGLFEPGQYVVQKDDKASSCVCAKCGELWVLQGVTRGGAIIAKLITARGYWPPLRPATGKATD